MQIRITSIQIKVDDKNFLSVPVEIYIDDEMKPWPNGWTVNYGALRQSADLIIRSKCDY